MKGKSDTLGGCDDLPLLLTAAVHHPERRVRLAIRQALHRWVEEADPRFAAVRIDGVLRAQRGTAIEPFVLNRRDRWTAALLARVAFSRRDAQTRFRVVGRETIGSGGGAMMTNHLRSYYIERYAFGRRRSTPEHAGFVAPAEMPSGQWMASRRRPGAEAVVGDEGIELRVGPFEWARETGVEARQLVGSLLAHSALGGPGGIPLSRGFRCTLHGDLVSLRTTGGESMLQLAAHMAQGSVLTLTTRPSDPRARVLVRLRALEGERMPLRCVATATSSTLPGWVKLAATRGPEVGHDVRMEIARWFRPHEQWTDSAMVEALL